MTARRRMTVLLAALPGASLAIASLAAAQPHDRASAPVDLVLSPGDRGLELGAASTIVWMFPTIGGHVSLPAGLLRVEAGMQVLPWLLEDGDDVGVMTQAQLRIPLRRGPPGSRRSLIVGVTAFTIGDESGWRGSWDVDTVLRPHAGVSWQWQTGRHLDLRLDLQGVIAGTTTPFIVPFPTVSVVWHGARGPS